MAQTSIITGQYVEIRQNAANVTSRIAAWLIDIALMIGYMNIAIPIASVVATQNSDAGMSVLIILSLLVSFYPLVCELWMNGQTVGKKALRIRVVSLDGSRPSPGATVIRWLLFIIDGLMMGSLGLLSIIFTRNSQRLGDLAAGTTVIQLPGRNALRIKLDDFNYVFNNYRPTYHEVTRLSWRQIETLSKTLYHPHLRNKGEYLNTLALKVQQQLGITPLYPNNEAFLKAVILDYQYFASQKKTS